uniref:TF-B3 domain-containing protein n=1 Tax=Daucus carota subsp. sativus TaxID=79200 RepID=A0A162A354_DAUCS
MESAGLVAEKFCHILKYADTVPNELTLPREFCLKYGHLLHSTVNLQLRNGCLLTVEFDRSKGLLNGVSNLFQYLELKGVTVGNGGWRFICFFDKTISACDEIDPPPAFLERCGRFLPDNITYLISNGKKFEGNYSRSSKKFSGLVAMFHMAEAYVLDSVHMLLFAFDGKKTIEEISNKFRKLCNTWEKFQTINVYHGDGRWMLDVRKRDDYYCSTIVDGWQIMRDCLKLNVGDKLVFQCPEHSLDHFSLRVVKNHV